MPSHERSDESGGASIDLAHVDAALAAYDVTADQPADRALQSFALEVRAAAPRPPEALVARLEQRLHDALVAAEPAQFERDEAVDTAQAIRVLVVGARVLIREGLVRALRADPCIRVVAQTEDARDAPKLAAELGPDVVVIDVSRGDDVAVVGRLRDARPATRALVIGDATPDALFEALGHGAVGYLRKGTTGAALRDAVARVASGGSVIAPSFDAILLHSFRTAGPRLTEQERERLRLIADGLGQRCPRQAAQERRPGWRAWLARWTPFHHRGEGSTP